MWRPGCTCVSASMLAGMLACDAGNDSVPEERMVFRLVLENRSAPGAIVTSEGEATDIVLSSGIAAVHADGAGLLDIGADLAGTELEALGEDGDPDPLHDSLLAQPDRFTTVVAFSPSYGDGAEGDLLGPGNGASFELEAGAGDRLSFVMMFVQSNDVMAGAVPEGIALDLAVDPPGNERDVTGEVVLYDLGTEVDEEPGVGVDQAPRQSAPNTGVDEGGTLQVIDASHSDAGAYPTVGSFLAATLVRLQ